MMHISKALLTVAAAAILTAFSSLQAQVITSFNVPTDICAGDSAELSFGFNTNHNTVIQTFHTTLGHSEQIFLPDGVPCNGNCSYQSPVTFTDFPAGAQITSVQDIKYVRLKIEHSYIGDIYIAIHCPNGNTASLMNYGGSGTSQCNSTIPANHRTWSTAYTNADRYTYFGNAYDYANSSQPCNPNASGNAPGTGWNYCWSNNTTSGYQYAGQDGLIYRAINAHNGKIDSSNVAAGTKFYKPNQNFNTLIGCPLNGIWYIEVIDGWSGDNGYIFEWELALDPSLIPEDCDPSGYSIEGPGISSIDDSTFMLNAPEYLTTDTAVEYTFSIASSCGGTIDTTAVINFHPYYSGTIDTVVCDSLVWGQTTYTSSRTINYYGTTEHGCDSTGRINLTVHDSYHNSYGDTIVENDLPYSYGGYTFMHSVHDTLLENSTIFGCDSNTTFTLQVYNNTITHFDTTLCDDLMPYLWYDNSYSATCVDTIFVPSTTGADSMMVLHLTVLPTSDTVVEHVAVQNMLPVTYNGQTYTGDTTATFHFENRHGCDSTVHYRLTVHYNQDTDLYRTVCDDQLPLKWQGIDFDAAGSQSFTVDDRFGADSTVTLNLFVNPTYDTTIVADACDNKPFVIEGHTFSTTGIHTINLHSVNNCDSTLHVDLTVYPHYELDFYDTVCSNFGSEFEGVVYYAAGSYPHSFLTGHGCDSVRTLHLKLLAEDLRAEIKAIPWLVTEENPEVRLYDQSVANAARLWMIGDETSTLHNVVFSYPVEEDSVIVGLVAYSIEGCTDSTIGILRIDRSKIAIPNVFTPGQETNNVWYVAGIDVAELEVWIYNRLGLLVAHLETPEAVWDGTHNGRPCQQGEYVYQLRYRTKERPDMPMLQTGTILLLR